MKNISIYILSFCLLMSMVFSENKTAKLGFPIRIDHKSSSKLIGYTEAKDYFVVAEYSVWVKVKIISGSYHTNKQGWVYSPLLSGDSIGGQGVNLRDEPSSKSNVLCSVRAGAKVQVIDKKYTWYKIQVYDQDPDEKKGWVYGGNLE